MSWKLEDDINDYVKMKLERLGLKKGEGYNITAVNS